MSPRLPLRLLAAQPDERLLELVASGHERAFEAIVHRYRRPLLAYCRRLGLGEARAEDVLQQALMAAWLALARGTQVRELRPWLYRIVHNAAVNSMRSNAGEHEGAIAALGVALGADAEVELLHTARQTLSDVADLPAMQRSAILMSALEGRSHQEVARALGVSSGAVRGLLYRARETLRAAAAAFTPGWMLGWIGGSATRSAPSAARIAEVCAAGDAAPVVLKGAAVLVTAALAAGAVLGPLHPKGAHPRATARPAVADVDAPPALGAGRTTAADGSVTGGGAGAANVSTPHALSSSRPRTKRPGRWRSLPRSPAEAARGRSSRAGAAPTGSAPPPSGLAAGTPTGASPAARQAAADERERPRVPGRRLARVPRARRARGSRAPRRRNGSQATGGRNGRRRPRQGSRRQRRRSKDGSDDGSTGTTAEREAEAAEERKEREAEAARERQEHEAEVAREGSPAPTGEPRDN